MRKYRYVIEGIGAYDQTWTTVGEITVPPEEMDQLKHAIEEARLDSFDQLVEGRAVYGKPGMGCDGPYVVVQFYLQLVMEKE